MRQSEILLVAATILVATSVVILAVDSVKKGKLPLFVVNGKQLVFALGVLCALVALVIITINQYNIR